jgi:hypothetical protein
MIKKKIGFKSESPNKIDKQIGKQKMSQSEDFSGISDDAVKLYANEGLPTPQVY